MSDDAKLGLILSTAIAVVGFALFFTHKQGKNISKCDDYCRFNEAGAKSLLTNDECFCRKGDTYYLVDPKNKE